MTSAQVEHQLSWDEIMRECGSEWQFLLLVLGPRTESVIRKIHNIAFENGRRVGMDGVVGMMAESFGAKS